MKTLWVLTQKQTSKGYMARRGWRQDGKPRFTKTMSLGLRFETEELAIDGRKAILDNIDNDIKQHTDYITKAKQSLTKVYKTIGEFDGEARKFGGYFYNHMSGLNKWTDECDKIRAETVKNVIDGNTKTLERYKKEKDYIINHIYIKEVNLGMRFWSNQKRTIEVITNSNSMFCNVCGGDIPNVQYLKVGWGNFNVCACCMEDKLIPMMQEVVKNNPKETKETWNKERFLLDLGCYYSFDRLLYLK